MIASTFLRTPRPAASAAMLFIALLAIPPTTSAQNDDCFACHDDRGLTGTINGRSKSVFVDGKVVANSVHGELDCIACHLDVDPDDLPHADDLAPVDCGMCHGDIQKKHALSLHGKAINRGDRLAPNCKNCHGTHNILKHTDPRSPVRAANIPYLCGACHSEGTSVQRQRKIHQDHILENYSESIHGEGLMRRGLTVTATCISCHTSHEILPHTDPGSSIARRNIANTCSKCHSQIEKVHVKVIKGELWEKQPHLLPACVDCHQPHKIRRVYYDRGTADAQCLECHSKQNLVAKNGRSMSVDYNELGHSMHVSVSCSQCHSGVNTTHTRPCDALERKVDCSSCHAETGKMFNESVHGVKLAKNDPDAPRCIDCHGTHGVLGKTNPNSMTFPTRVPTLCGVCHRAGEKGAVRTADKEDVVGHYIESIHGKGLLQSGLVVTAQCTDCHTAHAVQPLKDKRSSVHNDNVASTCGKCHHGIEEKFATSIHSRLLNKTKKELPTCNDCHSAHTIRRADESGFKLEIMNQCGRCHEKIADTYFETYHGKVSQLGYTKTAKCYDCHGAHDILSVTDPKSRLSRENVVETCKTCHPSANRQFAGYLTHATHHDPDKYPYLFWTFWGMTTLLLFTFVLGFTHTLLWLPRALKWRKELHRLEETEDAAEAAEAREAPTEAPEKPPAETAPEDTSRASGLEDDDIDSNVDRKEAE